MMMGAGDGGGACSGASGLYAGASSLGPLPPNSSSTSPPGAGGGLHAGAAHCGLLASGGAVGGSSRLVPVLGDPTNMSSSDQAFHVQYFKNILLEEIDDLRDDIRSYVLQVGSCLLVYLGVVC